MSSIIDVHQLNNNINSKRLVGNVNSQILANHIAIKITSHLI